MSQPALTSFLAAAEMRRAQQRAVLAIDPLVIKAALDEQFDDVEASPYQREYLLLRRAALARGGQRVVALAALLDAIEEAIGVDEAAREGGFVQGFECCRRLLLGELPLDVRPLPGGRRAITRPLLPFAATASEPRRDAAIAPKLTASGTQHYALTKV